MRTQWTSSGQGDSLRTLLAFLIQCGGEERAVRAAHWTLAHQRLFADYGGLRTGLALGDGPIEPVDFRRVEELLATVDRQGASYFDDAAPADPAEVGLVGVNAEELADLRQRFGALQRDLELVQSETRRMLAQRNAYERQVEHLRGEVESLRSRAGSSEDAA